MAKDSIQSREIIVEFHPIGNVMKVSAMDVQSLTEISIQGPANAPQSILQANAVKRLEYVLKKKGLIA